MRSIWHPTRPPRSKRSGNLSALQASLPSYPNTDILLKRLTALVGTKFDDLDRTITLKRDHRDEKTLAAFRTNGAKALTDEANVFSRRDHRQSGQPADVRRHRTAPQHRLASAGVGRRRTRHRRRDRRRRAWDRPLHEGAPRDTQISSTRSNGELEQRVATGTADWRKLANGPKCCFRR